MLAATFI